MNNSQIKTEEKPPWYQTRKFWYWVWGIVIGLNTISALSWFLFFFQSHDLQNLIKLLGWALGNTQFYAFFESTFNSSGYPSVLITSLGLLTYLATQFLLLKYSLRNDRVSLLPALIILIILLAGLYPNLFIFTLFGGSY